MQNAAPLLAPISLVCLSAEANPAAIVAGDVVVALAAGVGGEARPAPGWIKIAPRGRIVTRTGKSYAFDPEALAARFNADGTALPIDFEHSTVHLAAKGTKADAVAWIEEMEARGDGLYGRVDWLPAGTEALSARTHRYVSPVFHPDTSGNATWLHSVALVTAPALSNMPALAHAGVDAPQPETTMNKTIALALGLAEGADEAAVLSAIGDLKKPGETVDKAIHDQTLVTLSAATARLDAIETERRTEKVNALLDGALEQRRMVPAQRDQFVALCATDAGFEQVKALLAATPEGLAASGLDERRPETGQASAEPTALAAQVNRYMAEQKAAGIDISYFDAFAHVEANPAK